MSRFKRFTHSLATGYLLLGVTAAQMLVSVPLALHYLSKAEFGLWALVTQITGYLLLIDLGMSGSIARILMDHKDTPADGTYGSVIKTGALTLAIQGAMVAVGGVGLSFFAPELFNIPQEYRNVFQVLVAVQCVVSGVAFPGRLFNHILQAHHRYDASNYGLMASAGINLLGLWLGFANGLGLYSLLAASAAGQVVGILYTALSVARLKLFPPPQARGSASRKTLGQLFTYAQELFLLSLGLQMVGASQVLIISRTLGLNAAATWSIATKAFMLVQQIVHRPLDFSASALSEMIVRGERDRLLGRFRDLVSLTASFAAWAGLSVALCNGGFLVFWTRGLITWGQPSDWLMGLLIIANATTRCYVGVTALTKEIRGMKYIYLIEGIAFVLLAFVCAPVFGLGGVIASAIFTNIFCTGIYGFRRTARYCGLPAPELLSWLWRPFYCLLLLALIFGTVASIHGRLDLPSRLAMDTLVAIFAGFFVFWRIGLSPRLRRETASLLARWRA